MSARKYGKWMAVSAAAAVCCGAVQTAVSGGKTLTELDGVRRGAYLLLMAVLALAVLCGVVLAVVCFLKIWFIDKLLLGNADITLMVDAVVCVALLVTVLLAKLVGAVLPMAAKALKLDPAVMASPFITSIVDAVSLLVYFLFAKFLLGL